MTRYSLEKWEVFQTESPLRKHSLNQKNFKVSRSLNERVYSSERKAKQEIIIDQTPHEFYTDFDEVVVLENNSVILIKNSQN